jgi:hypothetical protein
MNITVNKDDAVTALAIIETHPERWDQDNWRVETDDDKKPIESFPDDPLNESCGTAGCLAGWVVFLNRVKWGGLNEMRLGDTVANSQCTCPPEDRFCTCGNLMTVAHYAQVRLGLDADGADALFAPENTLADLRAGVKALTNDEDVAHAVHASHWEKNNTECKDCFPDDDDE